MIQLHMSKYVFPYRETTPSLKSIVTLIGERGCGKTSLVANWVKEFQSSHPDIKVLAHYVGSSALSTDIRSFLRRVTFELRGEFGGLYVKHLNPT